MASKVCDKCDAMQRGKSCFGCVELPKKCDTEKVWTGEIDCPRDRHHKPSIIRPVRVDNLAGDTVQQPPLRELVAVTSLSSLPHHIERQAVCLDSWRQFGLDIVSVNTAPEIAELSGRYPQVSHWEECSDVPTPYDRRTPQINQLADVAADRNQTVLLLNSDIEIYGRQSTLLERLQPNTLVAGVRYNYQDRSKRTHREEWGIDAFVLTPEMASSLPRIPLAIGKPVWDYWLPLHFRSLGYSVDLISEPLFFHQSHPLHWSQSEWYIGGELMLTHYGESLTDGGREFRRSLD